MYEYLYNKPYRNCVRKELWEVIFGKDLSTNAHVLCTKSMEEKGGRPENGSFLCIVAKLFRKLLRNSSITYMCTEHLYLSKKK